MDKPRVSASVSVRRSGGGGFTTTELLVVMLIVAALVAAAVPLYLRQRERGYEAQMSAALRSGAGAMESYATGAEGDYRGASIPALVADEGLRIPPGISLTLPAGELGRSSYCIEGTHSGLTDPWHLAKAGGTPEPGGC
jgi:type IV pilus assembly protein PilA